LALAYQFPAFAPVPRVDVPVVSVSASLPGASPATMASSVAAPLERRFGQIAGITDDFLKQHWKHQRHLANSIRSNVDGPSACAGRRSMPPPQISPAVCPILRPAGQVNPSDHPIMIMS